MSPRLLLLVATIPALALAAPARTPVVAVFPLRGSSPELSRLGMLVEARATALLGDSRAVLVLDPKQVLAMASQEGFRPAQLGESGAAERARILIGADRVVAGTLRSTADGLVLRGVVRAKGAAPVELEVPAPARWSEALPALSLAVARAALATADALPGSPSAQPESSSDEALMALGPCWETALRQPMGIDSPVGLEEKELKDAVAACQAALTHDPKLRFATVTLGMLEAIAHRDQEAATLLGPRTDTDPALVPYFLAHFWLLTRNVSNQAGVEFLEQVTAKHPTLLVLRSYKGSTLYSMNEHARAAKAWEEYIALTPDAAFPRGRLSSTLFRLGKTREALAAAQAGLKLTPDGREARLVMAARQIDAGKLKEAQATLDPLVKLPNPPAEPVLQLGLAYLAQGNAEEAAPLFSLAADRASGPRALRTKGRALYWLSLLEAKAGNADAARAAYRSSLETGFVMTPVDPLLEPIASALEAEGVKAPEFALPSGIYVSLAPLQADASIPEVARTAASGLLKDRLTSIGAVFAPEGESKEDAVKVMKAGRLKGYQLRPHLKPSGKGLELSMLVMSYPELALKGTWAARATGGKTSAQLVRVMVPRVIEDAGGDLDWKN